MSEQKPVLTEEEMNEIRKKARQRTYALTRIITSLIMLIFLCLAWYGAEMLLYGYCQPSIVKAIIAVWLVMLISGRMQKEMILSDKRREFTNGFIKGLAKANEEKKD